MNEIRERLIKLLTQKGFGIEGATIAADHLIANGVTIQRWISVSESLPEKDMGVLLYDAQCAATFLGEFCSKTTLFAAHWFVDNETWDISEFTHWMPLPEPPIKKKRIVRTAKLREKCGMSQKALGKIVGKSQQTIAGWETGKRDPDIETLFTLADVFGCTLEELFDQQNLHDTPEQEIQQ